jgi:hypothetical protein
LNDVPLCDGAHNQDRRKDQAHADDCSEVPHNCPPIISL